MHLFIVRFVLCGFLHHKGFIMNKQIKITLRPRDEEKRARNQYNLISLDTNTVYIQLLMDLQDIKDHD